jgi:hypothetical protein
VGKLDMLLVKNALFINFGGGNTRGFSNARTNERTYMMRKRFIRKRKCVVMTQKIFQ